MDADLGELGRRRRRGNGGDAFSPFALFANGEQGLWYDPSDLTPEKTSWRRNLLTYSQDFENVIWTKTNSTVSTDAAVAPDGTTTAEKHIPNNTIALTINTASGCPIRRTSAVSGVAAGYSISFSLYAKAAGYNRVIMFVDDGLITKNCVVSLVDGSVVSVSSGSTCTVTNAGNGWYRVDLAFVFTSAGTASGIRFAPQDSVATTGDGTSGIFVWGAQLEQATVASAYQRITDFNSDFLAAFPTHALFQDSAGTTPVTALGQSVGRILDKSGKGNHAIQATSASRPTLQARANLLTYSEQFDNVAWGKTGSTVTANATTAPDGTTTADKLVEDTSTGQHRVLQAITVSSGVAYAYSIYVKANTRSRISIFDNSSASDTECIFDLSNGTVVRQGAAATAIITSVGSGWYRCTTVSTPSATTFSATARLVSTGTTSSYTGDGTSGLFIWGAQVERSVTPTTYQRVVTATDYADVGLPRNLLFDGVDDSLATTGNVDFSATDKVSLFSGLTKASDAAQGIVAELTASTALNTGAFNVQAPSATPATNRYAFESKGSLLATANVTSATYAAPRTDVVTMTAAIGTDALEGRINGASVVTSATDQGTGNFANAVVYVGRRGGATLPLNGRIFQLIIRGAATDSVTVINAEQYVAQKTGVTL